MQRILLLFTIIIFSLAAYAQDDGLTYIVKAKQVTFDADMPVDIYWYGETPLRDSTESLVSLSNIISGCKEPFYYHYSGQPDSVRIPYHAINVSVRYGGAGLDSYADFNRINGRSYRNISAMKPGSTVIIRLHRKDLDGKARTEMLIYHISTYVKTKGGKSD